MANPDQKQVLLEVAEENIINILRNYKKETGSTNLEIKSILENLALLSEKLIWLFYFLN